MSSSIRPAKEKAEDGKSESLRLAQIEMIHGRTGKGIVCGVGGITGAKKPSTKPQEKKEITVNGSHSCFWAPFILVGDWKQN